MLLYLFWIYMTLKVKKITDKSNGGISKNDLLVFKNPEYKLYTGSFEKQS
jgi:hypothetical protein